jgi:hypothetical protein
MPEEPAKPVIHDPISIQRKFEEDRRTLTQARAQIRSAKSVEEARISIRRLEFRCDELERHMALLEGKFEALSAGSKTKTKKK